MNQFDLKNRTALITGGAQGFGFDIAKKFLNSDANVIIWDIDEIELQNVVKKIETTGNHQILLCERGASFGYNTLVSDMRSLPILAQTGYPVIFDATHSVQEPGSLGQSTGGKREFVPILSKAAVAVGVSGIFLETHNDPDNAPSDGPNMIDVNELSELIKKLIEIDSIVKK